MSRWYRFMYRVGFRPWEVDTETVADQLKALLEIEESTREPPYGPALDLGCGTGRWSIELARRGWNAVGIDIVPKAVQIARQRANTESVDVAFYEGDVTELEDAGIGTGFSFFLDVECFNHLDDSQRSAVGRGIEAIAAPEATILLLMWTRARRGPLPPGGNGRDLAMAFPNWRIVDEHPYDGEMPAPLKSASPRWYRLAHT